MEKVPLVLSFLGLLVSLSLAGKPSLSDPLGLFEKPEFRSNIGKNYVYGSLWPKPAEEAKGMKLFALDPGNFTFLVGGEKSDVLDAALVRYKALTFPDMDVKVDRTLPIVTSLTVDVVEKISPMSFDMDESYGLAIHAPIAQIKANTVWGALRGLETFSQAVYQNESGSYFVHMNTISDSPRFHHRGFLIDTSRHYVPVDVIYQFIDALSYSKYNVLHWHIVDSDSFPYVSKRFPSLHQTGAFNNRTHIYTPEDVQNVIAYARLRGIRVLPEFDTPGHTASWFSIPNLLTKCYSGTKPDGALGPVDPTVEANYEFLKEFFTEIAEVFPDKYLHLGGDEVSFSCWESNPKILAWMEQKGMGKNFSLLEQYYEQKLLDIIGGLGKEYIIWQEVVDNQVKVLPNTIINIWKSGWEAETKKVSQMGLRSILSRPWYLNYISYGQDWPNYYKVDPQNFGGTEEEKKLVIGGTACMWGEWVDATNLISRTWARGLAIGERLWSPETVTDLNDAAQRIWEHRCRYIRRGLPAESVTESQYCRHEWMSTKH